MIPVVDAAVLSVALLDARPTMGGDVRVGLSSDGAVVVELDPGAADLLAHVIAIGIGDNEAPVDAHTAAAFTGVVADLLAMADRADHAPQLSIVSGYLPPKGHRS